MSQIDLEQYVQDALRTESRIDAVVVNETLLKSVLLIHIMSGSILDQIKKNVFYQKPYNSDNFNDALYQISDALMTLERVCGQADKKDVVDIDPRVFHSIIGVATESTELCEALASVLGGKNMDDVNILEEFGDIGWYEAIGVDALGGDLADILHTNIAKLKKRYPDKFSSDKAINRDTTAERKVLEGDEPVYPRKLMQDI